jgi:hypothetical protein
VALCRFRPACRRVFDVGCRDDAEFAVDNRMRRLGIPSRRSEIPQTPPECVTCDRVHLQRSGAGGCGWIGGLDEMANQGPTARRVGRSVAQDGVRMSIAVPTVRPRSRSLNDVRTLIPDACYRRSTARATVALLVASLLYLLAVAALALTDLWWALVLLWLLAGLGIAGLFVLGHDPSHGALVNSRRANRAIAPSSMVFGALTGGWSSAVWLPTKLFILPFLMFVQIIGWTWMRTESVSECGTARPQGLARPERFERGGIAFASRTWTRVWTGDNSPKRTEQAQHEKAPVRGGIGCPHPDGVSVQQRRRDR